MALQHLRSGTANKRPLPTAMSDGQLAVNTNLASPGLFFKDSNGDLVKVGPVHIGSAAPNVSPASTAATALVANTIYKILTVGTSDFTSVGAGSNAVGVVFTASGTTTGTGTVSGEQGNEKGEMWLDNTGGAYDLKIYDGTAWRSQAGEFVNATGDTMTGDLLFNNANIVFEGSAADDHETTLTVVNPTADRTITLPNVTGTVVTTGDTGSVTSTMITDGTIVNADVNAGAEIAVSKLANGTARQLLQTDSGGTGVEFTSNVDVPGTLDVTGTATFDIGATAGSDTSTANGVVARNNASSDTGSTIWAINKHADGYVFVGNDENVNVRSSIANDGKAEFTTKITVDNVNSEATLWLKNGPSASNGSDAQINFGNTEGTGAIKYIDALNKFMVFYVDGYEIMRLKDNNTTAGGANIEHRVGIGTSNPQSMLDVEDGAQFVERSTIGQNDPRIKLEKVDTGGTITGKITTDNLVTTGRVDAGTTGVPVVTDIAISAINNSSNPTLYLDNQGSGDISIEATGGATFAGQVRSEAENVASFVSDKTIGYHFYAADVNTVKFAVDQAGSVTAASYMVSWPGATGSGTGSRLDDLLNVKAAPTGYAITIRDNTTSGDIKASIKGSGDATFAGDVQSGGNPKDSGGPATGTLLRSANGITAAAPTGTLIWNGKLTGQSGSTSAIYSNGNASFTRTTSSYGNGSTLSLLSEGNSSGVMGEAGAAVLRWRQRNADGSFTETGGVRPDGSATFNSTITAKNTLGSGGGNEVFIGKGPTGGGNFAIYSDGTIDGGGGNYRFESNGSAKFEGITKISTETNSPVGGVAKGVEINPSGRISAAKASGNSASDILFSGFALGTNSPTSQIFSNGDATFAGVVRQKGSTLLPTSSSGGLYVQNVGNTANAASVLADGSATFTNRLKIDDSNPNSPNNIWLGLGAHGTPSKNYDFATINSSGGVVAGILQDGAATFAGNVAIGTSAPDSQLHIKDTSANVRLTLETDESHDCYINFSGATSEASIGYEPTSNSLIFANPADGLTSFERMQINDSGSVMFGTANELPATNNVYGAAFYRGEGLLQMSRGGDLLRLNRKSSDGLIVSFEQDGAEEGSITVNGSTVSYNGGHLARWSQLPSGAARTEILRGSVLSNLEEMCEWGEEDNEQLNRMKVSDTEGDKNVSGVFQAWDDDDDTYVNDFYCAMTGDFVIRIAQGTTVARGDLLMSAGDGTAKPQDDDIVRSKTIAKVTSTTVSETYADNSYCVPCVLMAC